MQKANVKLFVVKQNRLNSTIQLLKKQIKRGRFGNLRMVSSNVFWHRPQSYYDSDEWRGTIKLDGGAIMNQASHYVDLLYWLVGPIVEVSAFTATLGRNIEAEDTATINFKWRDGLLGSMAVTMLTYPSNLEGSITILGEKGTVKIGGKSLNKIEEWKFEDTHEDDNSYNDANFESLNVYGHGHYGYYSNLISNFLFGDQPLCDGEEGIKSLEIIIAAYKSSKENKIIKIPIK